MNENEIQNIVRLWGTHTSIANIIKMLPYERKEARQIIADLREKGILTKENRHKWQEVIINAYKGGMTNPYEIAEEYEYKINTVKQVLSNNHLLNGRPPHNYKKRRLPEYDELSKRTQQIIDALKAGKSTTEIRLQFNVSRQHIWDLRNKYIIK